MAAGRRRRAGGAHAPDQQRGLGELKFRGLCRRAISAQGQPLGLPRGLAAHHGHGLLLRLRPIPGVVRTQFQPQHRCVRRIVLSAHGISRSARDHRDPADGADVGAFIRPRELRQRRDGRRCGEPVLALRRRDLDSSFPADLRLAISHLGIRANK